MTDEVKDEIIQEEGAVSPVEEAKDVLAKIEEQNKIMGENLQRAERLTAENMISGKALAGTQTKEKTDEQKADEAARNLIKGSGFEDQLFPSRKNDASYM